MARIETGIFPLGSDDYWAEKAPVHMRSVRAFRVDLVPVTNGGFAGFVAGTCRVKDCGLFAVIGNAWEWTTDHCRASCAEPVAAAGCGAGAKRVGQGGAQVWAPDCCRRSRLVVRQAQSINASHNHFGFRRVLRDL